jgi:radical SAM protein (TIGR01212 family)
MLYNNLSGYLRKKYGTRLKKICIDGGFSCPNRDGKVGVGGCIFCGERGAGEHIDENLSITNQVQKALKDAKEDDKFIVYFQNFTNTYAPVSILKERYDAALIDKRIKVLAIGTRPDCIDREVASLIASYKDRIDVWVEMGLQSSSDRTAEIINRGYKTEKFTEAVSILREYGIDTVAHMIIGLPGESKADALSTAKYIGSLGIWGVKIHSIYVMKGTLLEGEYKEKRYTPPSLKEYVDICAEVVSIIPKDMTIHRLTGDCPKELLVAPKWNKDKTEVIKMINESLSKRGLSQGALL